MIGGREVRYFYGGNFDLEEVDFRGGDGFVAGTDYRYSGADLPFELQHNLVEIISPTGDSVLACEYGMEPGSPAFNRAIAQRAADAEFRYEYDFVFDTELDPGTDRINVASTLTRVIYPNGHVIEHQFNEQGNVVRRAERILSDTGQIEDLVARYRYNADGLLIEEIHPDGHAAEYRYGREAFEELRGGDSTATAADRLAFGNLVRVVERPRAGTGELRRRVWEYTHEPLGNRLVTERGPFYADLALHELAGQLVRSLAYDYDNRGNLVRVRYPEVTRPDGGRLMPHPTELRYEARGRLTGEIRGPLRKHYEYFADDFRAGSVREVIDDADGIARRTRFEVDALGRITRVTTHEGAVTDFEWTAFDAPRRVLKSAVAGGARPTITMAFDRARRVTRIEESLVLHDGTPHPEGALVRSIRYDVAGRQVRVESGPAANPRQRVEATSYEPTGVPARQISPNGAITRVRYDARLLPIAATRGAGSPLASTRRSHYNRAAEPIEMVDALGNVTRFDRDGFGRIARVRAPDRSELETEYDASDHAGRHRLLGIHPETGEHVRWAETDHRYDALGRLTERIDHVFIPGTAGTDALARTRSFYDAGGRLEQIEDAHGARWRYEYDTFGRMIRLVDPDGSETRWRYDAASRTLTVVNIETGRDEAGGRLSQVFRTLLQYDERGLPVGECGP